MALVNIIVKGIAMSYHKGDNLWRILFPFGGCHLIKFKEGENDPGIALAEADQSIQINAENAESEFNVGDDFSHFLDLTAEYSHVNGVRMKDGWEENAVLLTIENGEYSVEEYTATEHVMVRDNIVTREPQNIAYSSKIAVRAEKVIVNVAGHPDFPKTFDTDSTIIFDNDCGEGETREISDLEMVYTVIEDADNPFEYCLVAKVPPSLRTSFRVGTVYSEHRDSSETGLPCHVIIISKSENLP
jgi:hypothetical protein